MARKVRRGGKLSSRLKSLKRSEQIDAVAQAAEHAPISNDFDDDGPGNLTMTFGRWSGKRKSASALLTSEDVEVVGLGETGRATVDGVARKGGSFGDKDGFDGEASARMAYEAYMRGNIQADAERFEALRQQGAVDNFDPALAPGDVEQRGHFAAATHMVRLFEHWLLESPERDLAIDKAASWLAGFQRPDMVRKVLAELESKPIRDVYPLEILLHLLETQPQKLPGISWGSVLGNFQVLRPGERVYAGHPMQLPVPDNMRIKAFALLGGERPGYEFFPSPKPGHYTFQVDTPGDWDFALFAVRTEKLGKMERELQDGVVESFTLRVSDMGRKDAPAAT